MNEFWRYCAFALSGIGIFTVVLTAAVITGQIKFAL